MVNESRKRKLGKEENTAVVYGKKDKSSTKKYPEENLLLLSSTYDLNYTKGKRIDVGLLRNDDFSYSICIRIIKAGSSDVITMDNANWELFKLHMDKMDSILKEADNEHPTYFHFSNINLKYGESYGEKCVSFFQTVSSDSGNQNSNDTSVQSTSTPSNQSLSLETKTTMVLQSSSVQRLLKYKGCVSQRIDALSTLTDLADRVTYVIIEKCKKMMMKNTKKRVPDIMEIQQYLEKNEEKLVDSVYGHFYRTLENEPIEKIAPVKIIDREVVNFYSKDIARTIKEQNN